MIEEAEAERIRTERAARSTAATEDGPKTAPRTDAGGNGGGGGDDAPEASPGGPAPPATKETTVRAVLSAAADAEAPVADGTAAFPEAAAISREGSAAAGDEESSTTRRVFFGSAAAGDGGASERRERRAAARASALEDKRAKEAARAAERAEAKSAAEKQERLREETRRRAERELKEIAAAAERRARDAAKEARLAKKREAKREKMAKVREKEEAAAIVQERRAWERAEARVRAERERAERDAERAAKKEEEDRRRAEKTRAFAEERERKKRRAEETVSSSFARDASGSTANAPLGAEEMFDAPFDAPPRDDGSTSASRDSVIALVPGHWIDPGEETGSPGERELNAIIADKAHDALTRRGWTVLRPDAFFPPLRWDAYLDWARAQCASGVPLLEIHGQGSGAEMHGRVTGVISQTGFSSSSAAARRLSPLGDALEARFGRFPMDWRELVVSRVGGAVVESFETEVLERMPPEAREAAMDAIALDIAEAVDSTRLGEAPERGCSASGCPRA